MTKQQLEIKVPELRRIIIQKDEELDRLYTALNELRRIINDTDN